MPRKNTTHISSAPFEIKTIKEECIILQEESSDIIYGNNLENHQPISKRRFKNYADNHHSAIVSGSTYIPYHRPANQKKQKKEEICADAAAIDFIHDDNGIRTAVAFSTAAASPHNPAKRTNEDMAHLGSISCSEVNRLMREKSKKAESIQFSELYISAGIKPKHILSHCSLESTLIYYDNKEQQWQGKLATVGAGMIVVLDGHNYSIKECIAAPYIKKDDIFNTASLQEYAFDDYKNTEIVTKNISLTEGDIVLHLTENMYAGLNDKVVMEISQDNENVLNYSLEIDTFESILQGNALSADDIAQQISNKVLNNTLDKVQKFSNETKVYFEFLEKIPTNKHQTIKQWLTSLEKNNNSAQKYFNDWKEKLNFDDECDVRDFVITLKETISFGGLTTINVVKVPSYKLEVVRALVEHPENHQAILPHLGELNISSEATEELIKQLGKEKIIENTDKNTVNVNAYSSEELKMVKGIVLLQNYLVKEQTSIALASEIKTWLEKDMKHFTLEQCEKIFTALNSAGINQRINKTSLFQTSIGKKYTGPWHELASYLRRLAYASLLHEMKTKADEEKVPFLRKCRDLPLFNEHRNSFLGGGFGTTKAVECIDKLIAGLEKKQNIVVLT